MNSPQDPIEDRFIDALLHEQARSNRESELQGIAAAIDAAPALTTPARRSPWSRRLAVAAACVSIGGIGFAILKSARRPEPLAMDRQSLRATDSSGALLERIRDQEDKVEDRRKVLATLARSERSESSGDAIKRGLDSQDIADARRDLVQDEIALAELRARLSELEPAALRLRRPSEPVSSMASVIVAQDWKDSPFTMRPQSVSSNAERYGALVDPSWENPADTPLSTFSIDVDTASYSNIRRMIREGRTIPADAVRIEECINAFDYHDVPPAGDEAFAVRTALTTCPWNERHALVKIGIKGREIPRDQRPASNLVFLIDVSGSMQDSNKLPLVKECLKLLLHQLDERDSVSFVVYAGSEGVVLPPTKMTETGRVQALDSLEKLESGGSTNGGAGIMRAYQMAMDNFVDGGVNRVILATDGDFNVGITGQQSLVDLVKERAARHIYLSVLGFGTGNLNDSMLEAIGKDGNGNHFYIDGIREGRKVFLRNLSGTLVTIAKDVKIQVEFNPAKVGSYRLIGYANRVLKNEDFNNDKVDAGDIGAGHTVTAFYEIRPAGADGPVSGGVDPLKYQSDRRTETPAAEVAGSNEWLTLKLRHKRPDGDTSVKQESVVTGDPVRWQDADSNFRFATAVALFGMKLRGMSEVADITWNRVREIAGPAGDDDRAEFLELVRTLGGRER